ncbi:Homeodomain-containing transcription factor [Encephalitozoon romaleae SJ-2008]|uniref:Homeodomain-containing transcription factor n=1 Tax=Encephalitozoon romaleae (strain SJ-2008) TaxID=1178016 RepID=I7API3_ENCRO|nr:Homeodomain-containing transcription factor [Encephalitozoon romaleae SJ-2008]AFN83754.1 Homeodomain-containing transcription factor [Encephalitozoon romaleae SJ-2008]
MKDTRWVMEGEAMAGLVKLRRLSEKSYLGLIGYKYKTRTQVDVLKKIFEITHYPSHDTRLNLAILLNISPRTIQIWFQNSRSVSRGAKKKGSPSGQGSPGKPKIKIINSLTIPVKYIIWLILNSSSYSQIGN